MNCNSVTICDNKLSWLHKLHIQDALAYLGISGVEVVIDSDTMLEQAYTYLESKRVVRIDLSDELTIHDTALVLAHELVHVKQYVQTPEMPIEQKEQEAYCQEQIILKILLHGN